MTDEQKFFAWLDGELSPHEAAQIAAQVATDPRLADLARRHQTLVDRLRAALAPPERAIADLEEQVRRA